MNQAVLPPPTLLATPCKRWFLLFLQPFFYPSASCGLKYNGVFCTKWVHRAKNVIRVMNWTCLMWKGAFQMMHFPLKAATLHWCPSSRPFLEYIVKQNHCFDSYKILKQITDFGELITRLISIELVIFFFLFLLYLINYHQLISILNLPMFKCP